MVVYQEGYNCPVCGVVKAKLWWSNEENDLVASCTKCGQPIQRVIPSQPFSTPMFAQQQGHRGGPGPRQISDTQRIHTVPATPKEET